MKILADLHVDREREGTIRVVADDGAVTAGPWRCRGEADDTAAATAHNAVEDPTHLFGDHPFGVSRVTGVQRDKPPAKSYGPAFLALSPVSGQAFDARRQGRTGLGIHGGALGSGGILRPTFGCLRVDDATAEHLAVLVEAALARGQEVFYVCGEVPDHPVP